METVELAYDVYEPKGMRSDLAPIIVMHGLLWNKFLYIELATALSEATKRKVFVVDLRNHGKSPCGKDCNSYLMVEDIKRLIKDRNLSRVSFVCHSFSTSIAYLTALDMPDSVEKILMIDNMPFYEFMEAKNERHVYPQFITQNKLLETLDPAMTLKEAKAKFYSIANTGNKTEEYFYRKAAFDLTKENGIFKWKLDMHYFLKKYKERAFTPEPRGLIQHEVLIIRSHNSPRATDLMFERAKENCPNVSLATIENNTTHLVMFEESEKFVQMAKDFFST